MWLEERWGPPDGFGPSIFSDGRSTSVVKGLRPSRLWASIKWVFKSEGRKKENGKNARVRYLRERAWSTSSKPGALLKASQLPDFRRRPEKTAAVIRQFGCVSVSQVTGSISTAGIS